MPVSPATSELINRAPTEIQKSLNVPKSLKGIYQRSTVASLVLTGRADATSKWPDKINEFTLRGS